MYFNFKMTKSFIMKRIFLINLAAFTMIVLVFSACKKSYITGGAPEDLNKYKNTSTYDVLKSDPLYDTLVQIIDAAGIKDKINEQGTTFFAPSDNAILQYLVLRTDYVHNHISDTMSFALDSLVYYLKNNVNGTKDSMMMYLIHQSLPFSALTNTGALYPTELAGDTVIVSYEFVSDAGLGYNDLVSRQPQVLYFTQLWQHYDLNDSNTAGQVPSDVGTHTLIKTSGIITQNGMMNYLDNSNPLFFYRTN
jgi:hypothetical protein